MRLNNLTAIENKLGHKMEIKGIKKAVSEARADWWDGLGCTGQFRYTEKNGKINVMYFSDNDTWVARDPEGFLDHYWRADTAWVYDLKEKYDNSKLLFDCSWHEEVPTMYEVRSYCLDKTAIGRLMKAAQDMGCDFDVMWDAYEAGVPLEDIIA